MVLCRENLIATFPKTVIGIGGDHDLTWCLLRAARDFNNGDPVAVVHLDAHLDTGEEYHGNKLR